MATSTTPAVTRDDVYGIVTIEREGRRPGKWATRVATRFSVLHGGRWRRVYADTTRGDDALYIVLDGEVRNLSGAVIVALNEAAARRDGR